MDLACPDRVIVWLSVTQYAHTLLGWLLTSNTSQDASMAVISSVTLNADGPHSGGARERERCGEREIQEKKERE